VLRRLGDWLATAPSGPCLALALAAATLGCGGGPAGPPARIVAAGGPTSRIEERALSDRPPLSIIEREGDPEAAIAFASLATGSPELHAAWGEVLSQRLTRAGYVTELRAHGLGFELMLLAESPARARAALASLLKALTQPVTSAELVRPAGKLDPGQRAASAVAECSAELSGIRRPSEPVELERARLASFARDRSALSCVGTGEAASAVADALSAGPDWPKLGRPRSTLAERSVTQVLPGERPELSVALTLADANRALGAASRLGDPKHALGVRLAALGGGLRLRRVVATAHPAGGCLRIDSDVDASPLPDARRLGFAIAVMQEEARLALGAGEDENRLEATAISAADPRVAARAAAYRALTEPAPGLNEAELVALTTPDAAMTAPALDSATEQARGAAPELGLRTRVEQGQPGVWALVASPCAAASERADSAGHAAVFVSAASAAATRGARLEPWVGAAGVGLLGFVERAPGESDGEAAARLGDALGHALLAPPAAVDIASARGELIKTAGSEPHPLLDAVVESLSGGRSGALLPRGNVTSLLAASREAVLTRQRELLRLPHQVAVISPGSSGDASLVTRSLARWLRSPDALRPSPCDAEIPPLSRSSLAPAPGSELREGGYLAFRIPAKSAPEAGALVDVLNQPGGPLAKAMAEPDLVGAARAMLLGTTSARALVVQLSAFEGREAEALARTQRLFERLATGGVLSAAEIEAAIARQRTAHRLAALDPRYRLVQLLDPSQAPVSDSAALRRLVTSLRPDSALVADPSPRSAPSTNGKSPASR
jgi:hypothetical protein